MVKRADCFSPFRKVLKKTSLFTFSKKREFAAKKSLRVIYIFFFL
jgi:hypothetical protein